MAMNINDTSNIQKVMLVKGKNVIPNRIKAHSNQVDSTDKVTITETASSLSQMLETISEQTVIDRKRVEHIKRAIGDGSYKIDALKIAQKVIRFENDF